MAGSAPGAVLRWKLMTEANQIAPHATDPRYPIGRFQPVTGAVTRNELNNALMILSALPEQLRNAVDGLSDDQLDTPYREGGWTVRQLVHHIADSHMNAFSRFKLALTEDWPTIYAYNEAAWAKLHDSAAPAEWSLEVVEAVHARWVMLLQSLDAEQFARGFVHPERGRMTLEQVTLLYAWHSRHHVAHITHLRAARNW